MKCQRCGNNKANVVYKQIINGEKTELFLCDKCANDLNLGMNFTFDFNDVFGAFFEEPTFVKTLEKQKNEICDVCGTTYDDFARTGVLGCENCYKVFANKLDNVLKRLHGNNRHVGRKIEKAKVLKDVKVKSKSKIEKLKEKLQEHVKNEEYEKAAQVRDEIKKLEAKDMERGE